VLKPDASKAKKTITNRKLVITSSTRSGKKC